jgi:hypothetical protein
MNLPWALEAAIERASSSGVAVSNRSLLALPVNRVAKL